MRNFCACELNAKVRMACALMIKPHRKTQLPINCEITP